MYLISVFLFGDTNGPYDFIHSVDNSFLGTLHRDLLLSRMIRLKRLFSLNYNFMCGPVYVAIASFRTSVFCLFNYIEGVCRQDRSNRIFSSARSVCPKISIGACLSESLSDRYVKIYSRDGRFTVQLKYVSLVALGVRDLPLLCASPGRSTGRHLDVTSAGAA